MRKIFEVTKNGYTVRVFDFGTYKDIRLDNGDNTIEIYEYVDLNLYTNIQNGEYSKIKFKISTKSIGVLELEEMEELLVDYQNAVDAVKAFEAALQELELQEVQ